MSKKLSLIGLAVLVLIIGGVAILYLSLNRVIRSAVETYGPQATKSEVKLGGMRVALEVMSVLSDTVAIREIIVRGPEITYELGPGGSNLAVLQKNVEAYSGGGAKGGAQTPQAQQGGKKVIIDRLRVEQSKLYMSAVPLKGEPVTLALPDIELKNLGMGGAGGLAGDRRRKGSVGGESRGGEGHGQC